MDQMYKCGYCGFFLNSFCENLLEHDCLLNIFVEGEHDLVEDNKKVLTIVEKGTSTVVGSSSVTKDAPTESFEELLITYVQDRPALYNITLPLSERTVGKKNALWMEVFNLFGGKYTIEDLQKKWKYLRDCYIRARKKVTQYIPSGSGALQKVDPGFRHYALMTFLNDDTTSTQRTVCSVPDIAIAGPNGITPTPSPMTSPDISRESIRPIPKRRKTDHSKDLEKEILEAVSAPIKLDGVYGFLLRLGESLRKLPYRERSKLEI
ncbi:uncharacterized protein LOC116158914 [Photinus pyralis]|nr:uncharacterized protein LOC116158914 [Photinus pyralis]